MTQEEILYKMKQNYPLGTKARSVFNHNIYTVEYYPNVSSINPKGACGGNFFLYDGRTNKWAEIIAYPEGYNKQYNFEIW